jgi:hypothetical protein
MTQRDSQSGGGSINNIDTISKLNTVSPNFRLILILVSGFTVILLLIPTLIVLIKESPGADAKKLMDACIQLAIYGFGAICGLIGGKAA